MKRFALALSAFCTAAALVHGQQPAAPVYTQTINYVKVVPGKGEDYMKFVAETTMKLAQMRADSGEILSWTLLRSVYPAGQEARCDYMISTMSEGAPRAPVNVDDALLKKAGVSMSASELSAKRNSLVTLVASEMWRPRIRVGAPQKGHYLFINYIKVHNDAKYAALERTVWAPMSEEWVKQGAMSGWLYSTKMLPSGTDTVYSAITADMFPTWEAAFSARPVQATFAKLFPGKNYDEAMADTPKIRDLARRELWVVVERVTKKP